MKAVAHLIAIAIALNTTMIALAITLLALVVSVNCKVEQLYNFQISQLLCQQDVDIYGGACYLEDEAGELVWYREAEM